MRLSQELLEATYEYDKRARDYAAQTWKTLLQHVKRSARRLRPIQVGSGPNAPRGFIIRGPEGGLPDSYGQELSVLLLTQGDSRQKGSYVKSPRHGHMINMFGVLDDPDDPSELASDLQSASFRDVFMHEFIHYLDQTRFKGKESRPEKDSGSYMSTPAEFNAFYQEIAGAIEDQVFPSEKSREIYSDEMKQAENAAMKKAFSSFQSFRKYVTRELGRTQFRARDLEHAFKGTKWERKWLKRLHGLYMELRPQVMKGIYTP